jgi:hypothetical protein
MVTYKCTEIQYDTDGEDVDLPTEIQIELSEREVSDDDDDANIEELLADAISDETGWCVESFRWNLV